MAKRVPADERRRQIAQAAGELFAEKGVQAATVRDIGDRVGMLSGSLYHHFKTKNDIVHELMRAYGNDLVGRYRDAERQGGTARQKLKRLFEACVRVNLEYASETAILIHELGRVFRSPEFDYIDEMLVEVEDIFVKVLIQGASAGEIRGDIDPHFVYRMMMDVIGAVPRWYSPGDHSESEVVKQWLDMFWLGIQTR